MSIDWLAFDPRGALAGGALIGLAAAALALLLGRIAGISGIVGGLLPPRRGDIAWRTLFVTGLALTPWLYARWAPRSGPTIEATDGVLVLAGLLVGFGTRLGSGCTSGHGVCGVARGSVRSLAATAAFMASAIATVFVVRNISW